MLKYEKMSEGELEELLRKNNIFFNTKEERLKEHINKLNYNAYPHINEDDFYNINNNKKEFIDTKYDLDKLKKSDDPQKELCPSKDMRFKLLNHQIFIKNFMSNVTPYKSLLLFHGLGSGKTCSAISVAESYKKNVFGNINTKVLVLVSGTTIEQNFRKEIHDLDKGYNQCTFSEYQIYQPYEPENIKQKKVDNLIDLYYDIQHYQRFTNIINTKRNSFTKKEYKEWIKKNFSDRVFIIDEVHNLKEKIKENSVLKRYDIVRDIVKYSDNMRLVLLSGTPMSHSSKEIINILNLLLLNENFKPVDVDDFFDSNDILLDDKIDLLKTLFRGFISYVRQENPLTFPSKSFHGIFIDKFINNKFKDVNFEVNKDENYKIFPCKMEGRQLELYLRYLKNNKINSTELIQLGLFGYDVENKKDIYRIPFDDFHIDKIKNLSTKYFYLYKNILKSPKSPIFIYSNYRERGVLMIISTLMRNGIGLSSNVRNNNDPYLFSKDFLQARVQPRDPMCYYCYEPKSKCKGDKHDFHPLTFEFIIGETQEDVQNSIIRTFNSDENKDGRLIKILIGSSVLKEGVSLKNTRQVHIMDPWHNLSRIRQVIGRALRHCSHKDLPKEERKVDVYQYAAILEETYNGKNYKDKLQTIFDIKNTEVSVDIIKYNDKDMPLLSYDAAVYKRTTILDREIKKIEKILKSTAIDCMMNKELNIDTLEDNEKYECDFIDYQKLKKETIDLSTYETIFKLPYINYATVIIKDLFKGKIFQTFEDIISIDEFNSSHIYKENNYEIIRKALKELEPIEETFPLFKHIFRGGMTNNYGYIFSKNTDKNKSIYIFQELDGEEKVRSKYENYPLYYKLNKKNSDEKNTLDDFLNHYSLNSNINISIKDLYDLDSGTTKHRKDKVGGMAIKIIKDNYEFTDRDASIIGIRIFSDGIFDGMLWIRENTKKIKEEAKQFNTGKLCTNFTRKELNNLINKIWKKVEEISNKEIIDKYKKIISDINSNIIRKKEIKCQVLEAFLEYLHKNDVDGKIWIKDIKL